MNRVERNKKYARRSRDAFWPLRIRAWLQAPVVSDGMLPLDAVLYYVAHREVLAPRAFSTPGAASKEGRSGAVLPLARCEEHCPHWYYACSFAQWPAFAEGADHWNCRFDASLAHLIDFRGKRGKIDISSSTYKSYHMPVFYRHAAYVDWYAVGDLEGVLRLLRFATHLGKKTSQGWGAVLRWDAERWEHDWSVRGRDGKLTRGVPSPDGQGLLHGYRPAYWLPQNQAVCRMPGEVL